MSGFIFCSVLTVHREATQTVKMPVTAEEICKQIPDEVLNRHIHISLLDEIALDLVSWEELAPFLYLTNADQYEISQSYAHQYYLQKRQALRRWRDKAGGKATLRVLINVFVQERLVDLAERIIEICQMQPTSITVCKKYLHKHYTEDLPYPADKQWPSLLGGFDIPPVYIELTLLEVPINENEVTSTASSNVKVLNVTDVFKRSPDRKVILIEGVAGSGKTTFSWYACREWAKGKLLEQFHLLIHVEVKNPRFQSACKLHDLIPDEDAEACDQIAQAIIDSKGEGVCFLIEGLDEASDGLWRFIHKLLRDKDLSKLSFIITSRPSSRLLLELQKNITLRVALNGFTDEKLNEFLDSVMAKGDDERARLDDKLEVNHKFKALCTLPINAVITSYLSKCFKELPTTQTELFHVLLCHICIRHLQLRRGITECLLIKKLPADLPSDLQKTFCTLCTVAHTALSKRKRMLSVGELDPAIRYEVSNILGILQLHQTNTMFGLEQYYSFPHLSIQQFLAAIHISCQSDAQQISSIKQILKQDPLDDLLPFHAGLTHLANKEIRAVLFEVLQRPLSLAVMAQTVFSRASDRRRKALAILKCLYECQDESLMHLPEAQLIPRNNSFEYEICFASMWLSPVDCLAIAYFVRYTTIQRGIPLLLDLQNCSIGNIGMRTLSKELKRDIHSRTLGGVQLFLSNNEFNAKTVPLIKELLKGQANIHGLYLQHCFRSIDELIALKYIIEGLSSNSMCVAIALGCACSSNTSRSHVYHLILLITCCPQLYLFNITSFNLRGVMPLMNRALTHAKLTFLQLMDCNINDEMLISLGIAISKNPHLNVLDICGNPQITLRGLECFLLSLINKESRLNELHVDPRLYRAINSLSKEVLLQVNQYRYRNCIWELKVTTPLASPQQMQDFWSLLSLDIAALRHSWS